MLHASDWKRGGGSSQVWTFGWLAAGYPALTDDQRLMVRCGRCKGVLEVEIGRCDATNIESWNDISSS